MAGMPHTHPELPRGELLAVDTFVGGHSASHFTASQYSQDQLPNENLAPNSGHRLCFWEIPTEAATCFWVVLYLIPNKEPEAGLIQSLSIRLLTQNRSSIHILIESFVLPAQDA